MSKNVCRAEAGAASDQIPLIVRFETRPAWPALRDAYGVTATGAAVLLAGAEAASIGQEVSYSRRKNWYAARRHPLLTYRKTVSAVDQLEAAGLIDHWRQQPGGRGWQSAFAVKPEVAQEVISLIGYDELRYLKPARLTVLRDADGLEIDLRPTRAIDRQDRKTAQFNECIGAAKIEGAPCRINGPLIRIFNINMNRGGRFYAMGTSWQNITKAQRRALTINGEPVVEIDYKTLHPAMLYNEAGAPLPDDSYAIEGWPREWVKVAMNTMLNAPTEASARLAIAHHLIGGDDQESIRKAAALVRAIKERHQPIAWAFCSDAGARLMYMDAMLAESIMGLMILRHGVVTMPVHDSFLVPASKADQLEEAMIRAAYEVLELTARVDQKGD